MTNVTKLSIIAIIIIILELTYIIIDYNNQTSTKNTYIKAMKDESKSSSESMNKEQIEKIAQENYQKLMNSEDYEEMVSIVNGWKKESTSVYLESAIFRNLQRGITSQRELKLNYYNNIMMLSETEDSKIEKGDNNTEMVRQDITIEGGRALWAIEKLLDYKFAPISKKSSDMELNKIFYDVIRIRVERIEQEKIAKIGDIRFLSIQRKIELAKDLNTPGKVLGDLSEDSNVEVRRAIASNPFTPRDALEKMMNSDSDDEVKKVAKQTYYSPYVHTDPK